MKTLQSIIIGIVIVVIAFGVGYFVGTVKISELRSAIKVMDKQIKNKDAQIALFQIKDAVRGVAADVSMKNFGLAADKIVTARYLVSERANKFNGGAASKLNEIDAALSKIQEGVNSANTETGKEIAAVINDIDVVMKGLQN